jgi:hypothetical protein
MMIDKPTIINNALVRLGVSPVLSFDDESDIGETASRIYESEINGLLSSYHWNFCSFLVELDRLDPNAAEGFPYRFGLPSNALIYNPRALYGSSTASEPLRDYRFINGEIRCGYTKLWGEFKLRPNENELPAYFVNAFEHVLAGALAVPLTDRPNIAEYWNAAAYGSAKENRQGGLVGRAITLDANSAPHLHSIANGVSLYQSRQT